jgi:hypothetical protein
MFLFIYYVAIPKQATDLKLMLQYLYINVIIAALTPQKLTFIALGKNPEGTGLRILCSSSLK